MFWNLLNGTRHPASSKVTWARGVVCDSLTLDTAMLVCRISSHYICIVMSIILRQMIRVPCFDARMGLSAIFSTAPVLGAHWMIRNTTSPLRFHCFISPAAEQRMQLQVCVSQPDSLDANRESRRGKAASKANDRLALQCATRTNCLQLQPCDYSRDQAAI